MKKTLFCLLFLPYIYLFYLYLKKDTSSEPSKFVVEQDTLVLHEGMFMKIGEDRSVSMSVWENDSVETVYSIMFKYDTLSNRYLNTNFIRIKTEDHRNKKVIEDYNLSYKTTTTDTAYMGLIKTHSIYQHF